jgi:drug/metabolite transporter (DMT)-like permease
VLTSPEALALASAALFGVALVLTQFGLSHASPQRGAAVSIPTTTVLLWAVAPLLLDLGMWDGRGAAIFLAVGLLFPAVVTLLTFAANRQMGPSVSGALGNLAPLFAVALAAFVFGEMPRALQGGGIAAIVVGVVLLSIDRRWLDRPWPYWAAVLPLGAAAIRGFVQPVVKLGLSFWPSPFAAALAGYTVSALVVVAVRRRKEEAPLHPLGMLWFGSVGLCNGLAVLLMYAALTRGQVLVIAPLVATYPLVTLLLTAVLWRRAAISVPRAAGVALTVAGVALLIGG